MKKKNKDKEIGREESQRKEEKRLEGKTKERWIGR